MHGGATLVLMDQWDPAHTLTLVEQHRVTHTHMVPTMFHRLLALPPEVRDAADTSSLFASKQDHIDHWNSILDKS